MIRSDQQSAWRTMDGCSWHCTGGSDPRPSKKKKCKKGKMVVWGGLRNSWEKNRNERQRRKGKISLSLFFKLEANYFTIL